jgi:hypothetical protein
MHAYFVVVAVVFKELNSHVFHDLKQHACMFYLAKDCRHWANLCRSWGILTTQSGPDRLTRRQRQCLSAQRSGQVSAG